MSTNLSKEKREQILENIQIMRKKLQDDQELLLTLNEIEHELKRKKYGLVWEEHEEKIDKELQTKIPVFKEEKSLEIKEASDLSTNVIIEGDNLHSLLLLEKTHKNKVDLIIIDNKMVIIIITDTTTIITDTEIMVDHLMIKV